MNGKQRPLLRLSFHNVKELMEVKRSLMDVVKKNRKNMEVVFK